MSENSITIDGKEYISADRAARLVGYTKDYVGQLARTGKIKTKRIGRSWYIEEDSINKHKLSVHYILTKPKKPYSKKEKDTADININIDISSNPVLNTVQEKKKSDMEYVGPDTNVDLYPRIQEKRNDSLIRSDIRYEQVMNSPAKVLTEEERLTRNIGGQSLQKKENSVESFKSVAIRKQRPMRPMAQRVIAVDGIVSHSQSRIVRSQESVDTFPKNRKIGNELSRRCENEDYDYVDEDDEEELRGENSKMIPVIGGIGLFTILVVLYIVFSL